MNDKPIDNFKSPLRVAGDLIRSRDGGVATRDTLQELADGPILDPISSACPLGKVSKEEEMRRNRC